MVLLHDGMFNRNIILLHLNLWGRDSAVGIATGYGLNGPGIEYRWRRNLPHRSTPALETTQAPIQLVMGFYRGQFGWSVMFTTNPI